MMCSRLRPSLPHLLSLRQLSTVASRAAVAKQPDLFSETLAFEDPSAFRVKSWGELLRALGIFRLCSFPVLVNNSGKVKLTTVIAQQPYDLNLLVRAMDGERISFPGLDESEAAHFLCGLQRLNRIAEASVNKVRVLVDAEYTYMNPALSLVTMAMMKKFNRDGVWIWNTYQCYLKESRSLLLEALQLSKNEGFCLGVKLVRGAYMDKERKLADKEGRPDPIHRCWEDTNDSYNGSLDVMLEVISQKPERYRIIVASHNEESVRKAAKRMKELEIDRDGGSVCFGQLLGMCDHVSLTLAKEGYAVYKSVPYGSVDDTLPYLVRRAQENRTVLQGIRKERDLLRKEFYRRLRGGSS
ncbi:uncharacterized protein V6R79_005726 [Siganus canaliculatus]